MPDGLNILRFIILAGVKFITLLGDINYHLLKPQQDFKVSLAASTFLQPEAFGQQVDPR